MEASLSAEPLKRRERGLERVEIRPQENETDFAARLLASIGQPVVVVDPEFRVVYWNRGAEEILGWPAGDMLGRDVISAAGIELSEERTDSILGHLEAGQEVVESFEFTRRDGHRFPLLVNLTPLLDATGKFAGMVAIATDATERHAMEDANSQLSAIVESLADAVVGFDLDGRVTSWNRAASRLFGYPGDQRLARQDAESLVGALPGPPLVSHLPGTGLSESTSFESEYVARDGRAVVLDVTVQSVRDRHANIVGGAAVYRDVSRRRAAERQAAEEHQRLEEAQQIAKIGSFEYDLVTGELRWSRELLRILGLAPGDTPSVEYLMGAVHPADSELFADEFLGRISGGPTTLDLTYRVYRADGAVRWLHTLGRITHDEAGAAKRVFGSAQDITEAVAEEEARRLAEQRFSVAFELGSVGMLILDLDRTIRQVNPTICEILGRTAEQIIGHNPDEFCHPADLRPRGESATELLLTSQSDHMQFECRYLRASGETVHTIVHLAVDRGVAGVPTQALAQVVDITDRKAAENALEQLAMQDPLTGLPNRNLLQDRLATALNRSRRTRSKVAVLFVDVDRFKLVNDSLGHSAGDELLRQLARRVGGCARSGDSVARFGGDEFVLVCENVDGVTEATAIGQRIGAVCREPFLIESQEMYVTVSCGIVVASEGDTPATLLRDADTAMYRAKEKGRARAEVFDAELRSRTTRRLDIELSLRHGLAREEFYLEYQPIMQLPDEQVLCVEALIRWHHPERGLVLPGEFVKAAEDTGLILPIGEWVLDQAVAQVSRWRRTLPGAENLNVAVNLSPRQLVSSTLLGKIRDTLAAYGLPPDALCLEVTESTAMEDVEVSVPLLRRIADSGIVVALDDFGTGYSSLGRLKHLPVKVLKIDQSFVDGLGSEFDDTSLVHAIASLGQALNLMLCAEGVETDEQRAELVKLGCQLAQGFLWSPPLSPERFEAWFAGKALSRRRPRRER
ncbi:MAG: sensor domain-containing protein [Acidimicrobiales bacterium]